MKGVELPLNIKINNGWFYLDWDDGEVGAKKPGVQVTSEPGVRSKGEPGYVLRTIRGAVIIRFKYKIAEELNIHIRNWFREDKLPDPRQSRFTQVKLKPGLFMPELNLAVLIGYVEKYRKYLYPMMFDLKNQTCYLTGQPIYYNHDQWPMINQESLIILHNTTPKFERIDKISHDSNSDEMNSETHSNESSNETNSNESSNETNSNELNSKIIEDNFIFSEAQNLNDVDFMNKLSINAFTAAEIDTLIQEIYNLNRVFSVNPPEAFYQILQEVDGETDPVDPIGEIAQIEPTLFD